MKRVMFMFGLAMILGVAMALFACAKPQKLTPCAKDETRYFCPATLLTSPPPPNMCVTSQSFVMTTCSKIFARPEGSGNLDVLRKVWQIMKAQYPTPDNEFVRVGGTYVTPGLPGDGKLNPCQETDTNPWPDLPLVDIDARIVRLPNFGPQGFDAGVSASDGGGGAGGNIFEDWPDAGACMTMPDAGGMCEASGAGLCAPCLHDHCGPSYCACLADSSLNCAGRLDCLLEGQIDTCVVMNNPLYNTLNACVEAECSTACPASP